MVYELAHNMIALKAKCMHSRRNFQTLEVSKGRIFKKRCHEKVAARCHVARMYNLYRASSCSEVMQFLGISPQNDGDSSFPENLNYSRMMFFKGILPQLYDG